MALLGYHNGLATTLRDDLFISSPEVRIVTLTSPQGIYHLDDLYIMHIWNLAMDFALL